MSTVYSTCCSRLQWMSCHSWIWMVVAVLVTLIAWVALPFTSFAQYAAQPADGVSVPASDQTSDVMPQVVLMGSLVKTEAFPIDLETVLKLVDQQNLQLSTNRMGKKIEKSRFYQSLAALLPDFKGTYDHRRFQGVVQLFGSATLAIRQTSIEPGVSVSQRIYPGGKQIFDALSARQRVNASKSLVKETYQQQLARAVEDYYALLAAQYFRDFSLKSLEEAKAQVAIDEGRFKAGVGTRLEVMLSTTNAARRRRELIDANNNIAKAEQGLLNRLNLDVNISLLPDKNDAIQRRLVTTDVASDVLIARALKNHPALERLKKELKSAKWDSRSVLSELVPYVDVNANLSYRGPRYHQLGLNRAGSFTVQTTLGDQAGLSIPTRWLEKHRLVKQKVLEQKAQIRDIESQVVNAYLDSQSFEQAIAAAREENESAEESFRLSMGRYKAGVGIQLDVLTAESALSSSRSTLVQAILDYNKAQIQLLESIGEVSPDTLIHGFSLEEKNDGQ